MPHATGAEWKRHPGGWDTLHLADRWPSSNTWGFPDLLPQSIELPDIPALVPFAVRNSTSVPLHECIAHLFVDDYRLESLWRYPRRSLSRAARFAAVIPPDFSLYVDWPIVAQQWNTYRARWFARFWQEAGLSVIPALNWSDRDSFAWCFAGLYPGGPVALAVPDLRRPETSRRFRAGFDAMLQALRPSRILCYGRLPWACDIAIQYPTRSTALREHLASQSR